MAKRRRKAKSGKWVGRLLSLLLAVPAAYLVAALIGSLVPVNRGWDEPEQGTTVYLIANDIHTDIVMPINAGGLDWRRLFPTRDFAAADPNASFIAFGAGERHVYLDTPRWRDVTARTLWSALAGGERVLHVAYIEAPAVEVRAIRLRPEEYRRLWSAIRADLGGRPQRIDHSGYGSSDAFYRSIGRANAIRTCNSWAADKLRLAGVRTSIWPPFEQGLLWRYRRETWLRAL
jgi:uncharacterized protein (TIGR02117 family)